MDLKTELAGVGEKMQYCVHELNDNTVRFAIRYQGLLSAEVMGQAVMMVVKSVDVLHASFVVEGKRVFWRINEDIALSDCYLYQMDEAGLEQRMKQALVKPVKAEDKSQMFCTLIHGSNESALVLLISHLCVDGSDGKYLLLKLLEAYRLLAEKGDVTGFHIKNGDRSVFQVYEKCSKKEYRKAMLPKLSKIKSEFPFEEETGCNQIIIKTISAQIMEKAKDKGKAVHATVNDLLLTACYQAYAKLAQINENEAMSILSMMDLRCHCIGEQSAGLCNLSGPLSTELQLSEDSSFEESLKKVAAQTRQEKNNPIAGLHGMPLLHMFTKKLPFPILLKAAKRVYGNFSIGMTNLGNLSSKELILQEHRPEECIFAGPLKKKPGMQIAAIGMGGEVTLSSIGEFGNADTEKIDRMMSMMVEILEEFATLGS